MSPLGKYRVVLLSDFLEKRASFLLLGQESGVRENGGEDGILLSVMLGAFLLTSPINPSKAVAADSHSLHLWKSK